MKEELIRIENGDLEQGDYHAGIDIEIARGECIGIFSDNLINSQLLVDFFRGEVELLAGKGYIEGERQPLESMAKRVSGKVMILEKHKHFSRELSAWDYLTALRRRTRWRDRKEQLKRFQSPEAETLREELQLDFRWKDSVDSLSPLSFCKMFIFKAWLYQYDILVLKHITDVLHQDDIEKFMEGIGSLQQRGMGIILLDQDTKCMFSYCTRIDVMKNSSTCFRLYPEQFDEKILLDILQGSDKRSNMLAGERMQEEKEQENGSLKALELVNIPIGDDERISFQIRKGEIGLLLDRNYQTERAIRRLFIEGEKWTKGSISVGGKRCIPGELPALMGNNVGIQLETPGKKGRTLFYNLSGLENLSCMLVPKTGSLFVRRKIERSILREAEKWFGEEQLLKKVSSWTPEERLKLSYYKWYLVKPKVLICFFPFSGTDFRLYSMVMKMLSLCAEKGMGILLVSTEIEGICEKVNDENFIKKLVRIN